MNPTIRVILEGVYDDESTLSALRGTPHIVRIIWQIITAYWKSLIAIGTEENKHSIQVEKMEPGAVKIVPINKYVDVAMKHLRGTLRFPEPQNLNINMMPFVTGEAFEDCKLPENLRQYWDMILNPLLTRYHDDYDKIGKIGFLTIHECSVEPDTSQRRPGLHTDNPGRMHVGGNGGIKGAE